MKNIDAEKHDRGQAHNPDTPDKEETMTQNESTHDAPIAFCQQDAAEIDGPSHEEIWQLVLRNCIARLFCVAMSFANELDGEEDFLFDELKHVTSEWRKLKEGQKPSFYYHEIWEKAKSLEDYALFLETACRL